MKDTQAEADERGMNHESIHNHAAFAEIAWQW
jgi:GTP cyclohydrolase FolE2